MFKWLKNVFISEPVETEAATKSSVAQAVDKVVKEAEANTTAGKKERPSVSKRKPTDEVVPTTKTPPVSSRVQSLKSSDAVKTDAPTAKKVPTKTDLSKMTKENIEKVAREYNIELDRRMTKSNMIADFQKQIKN